MWGIGTPRTLRVHWMLAELGLAYETRPIQSRTGETQTPAFRRRNPREKIPVLEDGDLVVAESGAIVTWLAERYGGDSGLIPPPATPERAAYYEWCFFTLTELDAHTLYVIRRHGDLAGLYGEAPAAVRAARDGFLKQAQVAAQELRDGRAHLLGEAFSAADLLLASCLLWARALQIPLSDALAAFLARTTGRPAYRRAAAINFPPGLLRPPTPTPSADSGRPPDAG